MARRDGPRGVPHPRLARDRERRGAGRVRPSRSLGDASRSACLPAASGRERLPFAPTVRGAPAASRHAPRGRTRASAPSPDELGDASAALVTANVPPSCCASMPTFRMPRSPPRSAAGPAPSAPSSIAGSPACERPSNDERPPHGRPDRRRAAGRSAAARCPTPTGSRTGDLTTRLRRVHRRRQRVLGGVAIVAVFATGAALFGAGRARGAAAGAEVSVVSPATPAVGSTPVPVVPRPDQQAAPSFASSGATDLAKTAGAPFTVLANGPEGGLWIQSSGGQQPMACVRAYRGGRHRRPLYRANYSPYDDGNPFWDPPSWCFPTGQLQADVSTDGAAWITGSPVYARGTRRCDLRQRRVDRHRGTGARRRRDRAAAGRRGRGEGDVPRRRHGRHERGRTVS